MIQKGCDALVFKTSKIKMDTVQLNRVKQENEQLKVDYSELDQRKSDFDSKLEASITKTQEVEKQYAEILETKLMIQKGCDALVFEKSKLKLDTLELRSLKHENEQLTVDYSKLDHRKFELDSTLETVRDIIDGVFD